MEKSMIKMSTQKILLVSDLDGTLLNKNKKISEENERAIKEFMRRGGLFTIATGRMEDGVVSFLNQLGVNIPVVLYNGTKIYCPIKKVVLYEKKLTVKPKTLEKIISIHGEDVAIFLYQDSQIYTSHRNHLVLKHEALEGVKCKGLSERQVRDSFTKILVMAATNERAKEVEKMIRQMDLVCDMVYSEETYLEILAPEVSKGAAISVLKEMLEIEDYYTVGVGDQLNDVSLMKAVDLGIAVGNAHSDLKKVADVTTVHHEEHAIATIIKELDVLVKAEGIA